MAIGVAALVLICILIPAIPWERLPKRVQSRLEKAVRKMIRWLRENPVVSLESDPAPDENERRDAILDWLSRPEANLGNGGQRLWELKTFWPSTRRAR